MSTTEPHTDTSPRVSPWTRLLDRVNSDWHEPALRIFTLIVLAHWGEHLVQAYQVYALGWPLSQSRGLLGMPFPWLVASELLHYGYAFVMLVGLWVFRAGFVGRSYTWWMVAFGIQFWHHVEHALLQYQVVVGQNFLGSPAPISAIQMVGLLHGPAGTGFDGMLTGPPLVDPSPLLLLVRRLEVHLIYNTAVFIPMAVGMYLHLFPSASEVQHMRCACAWHGREDLASAPA